MATPRKRRSTRQFARAPLAAAILALSPGLMAQNLQLEEITVTAQKRSESMQDVPISIQALGNETLDQLNVQGFNDYARMLPSVQINTPTIGTGPGLTLVYMRGITSGGDGQATTSLPSVGMYLDEQAITTVVGNLDIHMYDIARVESLAGPQGTLYGASSQAGTIRIITNKPEMDGFSAGYGLEGNQVDGDDMGYLAEGYVNVPIRDNMAIRLVGWRREDAGYIDNVHRTRIFRGNIDDPADDTVADNANRAEDNYNTVETTGARAALRIDLNEDWTITPTLMAQEQNTKGFFAQLLSGNYYGGNGPEKLGDKEVAHFSDEYADDSWYQAALTVEGKIGNFDVVYAGSYLNRNFDSDSDYSDYSYFYDQAYSSGSYAGFYAQMHVDDAGNQITPIAHFTSDDRLTKESHELRISTPSDRRIRATVGLFWQKQEHDFDQRFKVDGLARDRTPNGLDPNATVFFPDTVYLNHMLRTDEDKAIFANVSFDITDQLTLDVGGRYFEPKVEVDGFFGFGRGLNGGGGYGWSGYSGERQCETPPPIGSGNGNADYQGGPCRNVDGRVKNVEEDDHIGRVNLSYKITDDAMIYGTWSEGYRSGGINRNPAAGYYVSDFLTNWEAGWKTTWFDHRLQYNGAVFFEKWKDFQASFQGDNGITQVLNGPTAEVWGSEQQLLWAASEGLTISAAFAWYDTELQDDYCPGCGRKGNGANGTPWAPEGTRLPLTAKFKGNLIARYEFPLSCYDAHVQAATSYEGERSNDLNLLANEQKGGSLSALSITDLTAGVARDNYAVEAFVKNVFDEDEFVYSAANCAPSVCGPMSYGQLPQPRTIGIKFSQHFD